MWGAIRRFHAHQVFGNESFFLESRLQSLFKRIEYGFGHFYHKNPVYSVFHLLNGDYTSIRCSRMGPGALCFISLGYAWDPSGGA